MKLHQNVCHRFFEWMTSFNYLENSLTFKTGLLLLNSTYSSHHKYQIENIDKSMISVTVVRWHDTYNIMCSIWTRRGRADATRFSKVLHCPLFVHWKLVYPLYSKHLCRFEVQHIPIASSWTRIHDLKWLEEWEVSEFLHMTSLLSYSFSLILSCSLIPNAVAYSGRCSRFRGRRWVDVARVGLRSSLLWVSIAFFASILVFLNTLQKFLTWSHMNATTLLDHGGRCSRSSSMFSLHFLSWSLDTIRLIISQLILFINRYPTIIFSINDNNNAGRHDGYISMYWVVSVPHNWNRRISIRSSHCTRPCGSCEYLSI